MNNRLKYLLIILALIAFVICSCTNEPLAHEHTFSKEWVYDENYHWHSSTCGHDVISGKANHVWDEGVVTKEASHTEDGVRTFSCKTCGYARTESIPAKTDAHTFSELWSSNETSHWHASSCGHNVISDSANHVWDNGVVTKEATHVEDGILTYVCTICGYTKTESIPARIDEHSFSEDWDSDDSFHWHPSSCGHDVISGKAEHLWDDGVVTKNPTHYEDGERIFTCSICNSTRIEKIPAHSDNHTYSDSWTSDDTFHWHASTCGHYVISDKAEHEWNSGVVVKEPTHFEEGARLYVCMTCDKTKVEILPALVDAHIFSEDWTWDDDYHWHASTCGHDVISGKAEHEWTDWTVTVAPTCLSEGVMTGTCAVCGKTTTATIAIDDAAHIFSDDWTADADYHWHASTCGHDIVFGKADHSWNTGVVTKDATHTENGVKTYTCTVCGQTKTESIPALADAHSFSDAWTSDTDYHWHATTCGHDVVSSKAEHEWDDGVVVTKGSYTDDWELLYTCTVCGKQKTEIQSPDEYIARFEQYFDVTEEGTLSVKSDVSLPSDVIIPVSVNGREVITIGAYAFISCDNIFSVSIPDSVTIIGNSAFSGCSNLESILLPDSITHIERRAFYNCYNLSDVSIPKSVTSIGKYAFVDCKSLETINIPASVTSIGDCAFIGCTGTVVFAEGMTIIPDYALSGACNIAAVVIPNSVTSIGKYAFANCNTLSSIPIPDSVTSIGEAAFRDCKSLTSLNIPNSVNSLEESVFQDCSSLSSITIPESVTSIKPSAFSGCISLSSIIIPKNVTEMKGGPFSGCTCEVIFEQGMTKIPDYALYGASEITSISIPNTVTTIGNNAFSSCSSLTSITIPDSIMEIGDSAFEGCSCAVIFADGTTAIPAGALYGASKIKTVNIPNTVTCIGEYAFFGCSTLSSITIPDSVISIGAYAFGSCSSLTSITIPNSVTEIGEFAFSRCSGAIVFEEGRTTIPQHALANASMITSVIIPSSIISIEEYAFFNCTSLTEITIPDSVTSIGSGAFEYCSSLTSISIPCSITDIEPFAFDGCTGTIVFSDGWTAIPPKALYGAHNISSVVIADSVKSIGDYVFFDCNNLSEITTSCPQVAVCQW